MDGAFYRGNATEQSNKFSDKEKKLLREMKFEKQLETEVNLKKIDINVIKPWITQKLTTLLGMEDDVVNEYVFSQLEEKQLNPKIMQINLTGFLNARRAREFMGELWQLLIEAQNSADGIPMSLVQKKIEELKANDQQKPDDAVNIDLKDTSSNWNNRYQSLTYGKYKPQVKEEADDEGESTIRHQSPKPRSSNDRDRERRRRDRSDSPDRRRRDRYDDRRSRDDRHRERRHRDYDRRTRDEDEDRRRKRSRTPEKRKKSKRERRSRTPERREKKRSRSPRKSRKRSPSSERRERSKSDDS